jgi:uncharacterized protein YuzE
MNTLRAVVPEFLAEVDARLASRGRSELSPLLTSAIIQRWTHDPTVDAGYIYFVRPKTHPHFARLAAQVAETIPFLENGFNIDLDHDGQLFGMEFLSRQDVVAKLRAEDAL